MTYQITLAKTEPEDLSALFQFQLNEEANYLAAFTSNDASDKIAYIEKYTQFLTAPTINMRTIRANGEIVGSISKFEIENEAEITYWIDRKFWGQGIATAALQALLKIEKARPIFGRVAYRQFWLTKSARKMWFCENRNR
jgi:ribosomal-protein-alanine N-acetyltransferase